VRGPQPCLRHARPRHVHPAQPPASQGRGSRWRSGTLPSLQRQTRLGGRHTQRHIARRRRAREHDWLRSSDPSRDGSSTTRRPAHRQVKMPGGAPRRRRFNTGKHPRGRGEDDGRGVLTSGRQCSRGRLEGDVHIGVVAVPDGGVPSAPVPWPHTMLAPTARRLPFS
jgi:hypothetical protein